MEVYAIKVTLLGIRPPVWRRILVDREITLSSLHRTLQTVMGWENAHLHQFVFPSHKKFHGRQGFEHKIVNESRTRLGDLIWAPGARLLYEYDFGDDWQHELLLEEVLLGDNSFQQMCVAGERCCPPEDCGGPQGYAELLEVMADANHPEHEEVRAWLGDFTAESFSKEDVNRRLRRRKHGAERAAE